MKKGKLGWSQITWWIRKMLVMVLLCSFLSTQVLNASEGGQNEGKISAQEQDETVEASMDGNASSDANVSSQAASITRSDSTTDINTTNEHDSSINHGDLALMSTMPEVVNGAILTGLEEPPSSSCKECLSSAHTHHSLVGGKEQVRFIPVRETFQPAVHQIRSDITRAEHIMRQQLGLNEGLSYLNSMELSLEDGYECPEEGIELSLPVDVPNGTQIIMLQYQEITQSWEAQTNIAYQKQVKMSFHSFSAIILYELLNGSESPVIKEDGVTYCNISFTDIYGQVVYSREVPVGSIVDPYANQVNQWIGLTGDRFFEYWSLTKNGVAFDFAHTPIERNLTFIPVLSQGHLVLFISKGTQVDPQLVKPGGVILRPENPTRAGYTFVMWSLEVNGSNPEPYDFSQPIMEHTNLYAVWKPQMVNYNVILWVEKPNIIGDPGDDINQYEFYKEYQKKATAESMVDYSTYAAASKLLTEEQLTVSEDIYKITYAQFSHGEKKEISGTGTSTINLYYKRIVYTISFDLNPGTNSNAETNHATMQFPRDGYVYQQGYEILDDFTTAASWNKVDTSLYQFKAKYEQDIEHLWPSSWNANFQKTTKTKTSTAYWSNLANEVTVKNFSSWSSSGTNSSSALATKRITLSSSMLPRIGTSSKYTATWGKTSERTVNYYLEQLPEQSGGLIESFNGVSGDRSYLIDQQLSQYILSSSSLSAKDLDGFKYVGEKEVAGYDKNTSNHFFYTRNTWTLHFNTMGGSKVSSKTNVMYAANLSYQNLYLPQNPPTKEVNGIASIFAGWYLDAAYKIPFISGHRADATTMPNHDLTLYAKWIDQPHKVSYYPDMLFTSLAIHQETVAHGGYAKEIPSVIHGQQVKEWYLFVGVNGSSIAIPYHAESIPVNKDLKLYATYNNAGFTVTYHVEDDVKGNVPRDEGTYRYGTSAVVLSPANLSYTGYIITGWKCDQDGKIYRAGDVLMMYSDRNLHAVWEKDQSLIEITTPEIVPPEKECIWEEYTGDGEKTNGNGGNTNGNGGGSANTNSNTGDTATNAISSGDSGTNVITIIKKSTQNPRGNVSKKAQKPVGKSEFIELTEDKTETKDIQPYATVPYRSSVEDQSQEIVLYEAEDWLITPAPRTESQRGWALLNLLLTLLTAVLCMILLYQYYQQRKEEHEVRRGVTFRMMPQHMQLDYVDEMRAKSWLRLMSVIPMVAAFVLFLLTEDMRNPMMWVDRWTALMVLIVAVQGCVMIMSHRELMVKKSTRS